MQKKYMMLLESSQDPFFLFRKEGSLDLRHTAETVLVISKLVNYSGTSSRACNCPVVRL